MRIFQILYFVPYFVHTCIIIHITWYLQAQSVIHLRSFNDSRLVSRCLRRRVCAVATGGTGYGFVMEQPAT